MGFINVFYIWRSDACLFSTGRANTGGSEEQQPIGSGYCRVMYRCKKVHDGVTHAAKLFPNSWFIMVVIGAIKGNGSSFVKVIERLLRGVWTPTAVETMAPGFASKASLVAALLFVLDEKTELIAAPHALVYFGVTIFFVYFKLSSLLLGIHDPFVPVENLFCAIFMGGIWDSLQRVMSGKGGAGNPAAQGISDQPRSDAKPETAKKKD